MKGDSELLLTKCVHMVLPAGWYHSQPHCLFCGMPASSTPATELGLVLWSLRPQMRPVCVYSPCHGYCLQLPEAEI